MQNQGARKPILCVLKEVASDPATFEAFLRNLAPDDLADAWELAFELARLDDIGKSDCADLLAAWCTAQLLARIFHRG